MTFDEKRNGADEGFLSERQVFVLEVSVCIATGLRRAAAKNNVRQLSDFLNGLAFCGLLLEGDGRGKGPRFGKLFQEKAPLYRQAIESKAVRNCEAALTQMAFHEVGVTDLAADEMLITVGLASETAIREISEEYGFSAAERMEAVTIAIVLGILAVTKPDRIDEAFEKVGKAVSDKSEAWNSLSEAGDAPEQPSGRGENVVYLQ